MKKITLLNIITALILQITVVISGFIIPKIVLTYFGSGINGLVSSINQFLSYITLVEGGITGVIMANLYKPLVEKDAVKLSSIIVTSKKFYEKVGLIFIAYTMLLAVGYPLLWGKDYSFTFVFFLVLILSITLMVQYMFSLTLKSLLSADKKLYIVNFTQIIIVVLNVILAYASVKIYPSIHILKLISGLLFVLQPLIFGQYVKKNYDIDWKVKPNNDLVRERWNGFAINIAAFIHNSTDIVVLTVCTSLQTVSVYSVYTIVTNGLRGLLNSVFSGINPTLGQAYATGDKEKLNRMMDIYEYITFVLVFYFFTIAALLITPFVLLYTKGVVDADYNQEIFGFLIVLSEALYLIKSPHLSLAYVANKFKEVTTPAYVEAAINIVLSVVFVGRYGLLGVAIGTICGMIYRMIFHIYFTSKLIPGRSQGIFYKKFFSFLITTIIGIIICKLFMPLTQLTVGAWVIHAIIYCLVLGVLYLVLSIFKFKKELRFFMRYLKR